MSEAENSTFNKNSLNDKVTVGLDGGDILEFNPMAEKKYRVSGCPKLMSLIENFKKNFGADPKNWLLPEGNDHSAILLREFILRVQNKWQEPYAHAEICHCRQVSTKTVDQSIMMGCHTMDSIRRSTSANTACGACMPDIESLLATRLQKK